MKPLYSAGVSLIGVVLADAAEIPTVVASAAAHNMVFMIVAPLRPECVIELTIRRILFPSLRAQSNRKRELVQVNGELQAAPTQDNP
jgi:hypothetical protein